MAINRTIRFEVFKRDGFRCQYCGKTPPEVTLEVDHIIPRSKNGGDETANLLTACFDCNRGKGKTELSVLPAPCDDRAEQIKEQEEQLKALYLEQAKQRRRIEKDIVCVDEKFQALEEGKFCLSESGRRSVRFLLKTFTKHEIEAALEEAYAPHRYRIRDKFAYACGILWNSKRAR